MELTRCRELRKKITALEEKLKLLRATTTTARRVDGMPTAPNAESVPERVTRLIVDGERELETLREEFAFASGDLAAEIFQRVSDMKSAQVLFLRYVNCLAFDEIAARTGYARGYMFRLHRAGKAAFASEISR